MNLKIKKNNLKNKYKSCFLTTPLNSKIIEYKNISNNMISNIIRQNFKLNSVKIVN